MIWSARSPLHLTGGAATGGKLSYGPLQPQHLTQRKDTQLEPQWRKVFSQPPIIQVLPFKRMREACN